MGRHVFKLPDVGEGTAEAEIVAWHVAVGDLVEEDQPLVDVLTDKATVEMTAPVSGRVAALYGEPGDMAAVGAPLAEIDVDAEGAGDAPPAPARLEPAARPRPVAPGPAEVDHRIPPPMAQTTIAQTTIAQTPIVQTPIVQATIKKPMASPAVRRRAQELGIDLRFVEGSGPAGRVTRQDLEGIIAEGGRRPGGFPRPAAALEDSVEDVKVIGLRRKIAERMQDAKRRIPHFAYVEEIDVTELEDLRAHLNLTKLADQPRLTVLPFLIRALVVVLPRFPQINARFDDDLGIVHRHRAVHAGIATQTAGGLIVPVLRHAESRDLWGSAAEITRLSSAAREGKASADELRGSTITITSLGPLGGVATTPVINHPEVAIIGPNRIIERPVVRQGRIDIRKMMNLSSSFDHRVVDGYDAAEFIQQVKARLEHPATLFLEGAVSRRIQTRALVVGGGPGGYVAAIRLGQLGVPTVLVEADRLGGTCLIRGCIPSKAIIEAASRFHDLVRPDGAGRMGIRAAGAVEFDLAKAVGWKNGVVDRLNAGVAGLLERAKVEVIAGWASFSDAKTCVVQTAEGAVSIAADQVILATGSVAVELPSLPFGGRVISSTEALDLTEAPRRLAVVGAGYIGLELGIAFRKLGSEVTVIEAMERILPLFDSALSAPVKRWLERAGVTVHLGARAMAVHEGEDGASLSFEDKGGAAGRLEADRILVTIGRRPNIQGWGLETMAVDLAGPFVKIDDQCRTSMKDVWAIGDLVGEPMLEHKAAAQGEMVAEIIAGGRRRFDPVAIAAVCFTEPEIVSAGLSPDEARAEVGEIITGVFPFSASGRARSMGAGDDGGFVRVVAAGGDHRLLGIQAVGAHVAELSGEFALALEMGAVLEDIAGTIHVHPTLGEALHEAALRALGKAIHV